MSVILRFKKAVILLSMIALFAALLSPVAAQAQVPRKLTYQGYLTDLLGNPITSGVVMTFTIYDAPSGGSALWSEPISVTSTNGVFSVILPKSGGTPFPSGIFDTTRYLGVQVGVDAEMTPRQEITSSAYAITAEKALTLSCASCVTSGMIASGAVTASKLDTASFSCSDGQFMQYSAGGWACGMPAGNVTSVTAGTGLSNSGTSSAPILNVVFGAGTTDVARGDHIHDYSATFVNVTGDTMTGILTVPGLVSNATVTVNAGINTAGLISTATITATGFSGSGAALTGITYSQVGAAASSHTHSDADLSGTVPVTKGGTGATTASAARTNLSAAASGANTDITSLSGLTTPLSISQGGIGSATKNFVSLSGDMMTGGLTLPGLVSSATVTANAGINTAGLISTTTITATSFSGSGAALTGITYSQVGAAATSHSHSGLEINSGTVGLTYGGTGATTASAARTNLGAAASGANADITSLSGLTTPLSISQGGTGSSTQNFVDLSNNQTIGGNKTFSSPLISNISTGTAPFSVASQTLVSNLNAEMVGNQTLTNLDGRYLNASGGDSMTGTLTVPSIVASATTNTVVSVVLSDTTATVSALSVISYGTGTSNDSAAGRFEVSNTSSVAHAVYAASDGTLSTITGHNTGSGGAGRFTISNADNSNNALYASTNGTGRAIFSSITNTQSGSPALYSYTTGTGSAGQFAINNTTNYANALYASTNGYGSAGNFQINNGDSSATVLNVSHNGQGSAIVANAALGGNAVEGINSGTGKAGQFQIVNSGNSNSALYATTNGSGNSMYGYNSGTAGSAGYFQVNNTGSGANALRADTNSANSGVSAIFGWNTGSGPGVKGQSTGVGVYGQSDQSGYGGYFTAAVSPGIGVYGSAPGYGGYFTTTGIGIGIYASSPSGYAGDFSGNVRIQSGNLELPTTTSTAGIIKMNGANFIHAGYSLTNFFAGYLSGNLTNTGSDNTAVGTSSLASLAGGTDNTALGWSALNANSGGSFNTAVGSSALKSNTVTNKNTAVGTSALFILNYSTPFDSFNTAVGFEALYSNQPTATFTGYENTAVGALALRSNTVGIGNVAVGKDALYNNTTAGGLTAVGTYALQNNTQSNNSAFGYAALYSNTTGGQNTAVGYYALQSSQTGTNNTAVGYQAGQYNVTGQQNTFIGALASVPTSTYSGLSNATAIGYNAKVDSSNKVVIGNSAVTSIGGYASWSQFSDRRTKTDIQEISYGLDFVRRLRPVSFKMKNGNGNTDFGFVAQDIEALLGTSYNVLDIGGEEERMLSLRYSQLIAPMVKAMQEQQIIIEDQKAQIQSLEERLARIEALLNSK